MRDMSETKTVPLAGNVVSVMLSMVTIAVLASCLTRRFQSIYSWRVMPLTSMLIIAIYIDSTLFVLATATISQGLDINVSRHMCDGAILLCLTCYLTTKVMIYYFLVEKAFIIRGSRGSRLTNKLYLVNFFATIVPYLVVIVMNFVFRFAYINEHGVCIIGMERISMIPLISFEVIVNIYLTLLFLIPLRKLYSYQHNQNTALRTMAMRTFIGSCATLASSVVNLTVLMVLKGEPGWICLMCCNADILFSVIVLHWVTAIDTTHSRSQGSNSRPKNNTRSGRDRRSRTIPNEWNDNKAVKGSGLVTTTIGVSEESGSGLELDTIRVQTEQTQEISDATSDMTTGTARGHHVDFQHHDYQRHEFPARSSSTEQMV